MVTPAENTRRRSRTRDHEFEILVQNLILDELQGKATVTRVDRVLERPQRGKDFVIEACGDLRLFGVPIECRSTRGLIVHVECKWSSAPVLSFERVASNAAQNRNAGCDAFVVVTNSSFTAGALWDLYKLFEGTNTRVVVVDGVRLREIVEEAGLTDQVGLGFDVVIDPDDVVDGVLVRDDMNTYELGNAEITIALQNRTPEPRSGELFLQSDTEWILQQDDAELLVHLPPYGVQAFRLNAKREFPDRKAALRIGLDLNGALRSLKREYAALTRLDFRPTFVGDEHDAALGRLVKAFDELRRGNVRGLLLGTVFGPAGTGKSRLVQELEARLKDVRFRWLRHTFPEPGGPASLEPLLDRAEAIGFPLGSGGDLNSAESLIRSFAQSAVGFGSQIPVLVLEDAHHADGGSCGALIDLIQNPPAREKPLALLLTGRTDHSHGNADFQRLSDLLVDLPAERRHTHVTLARFDLEVARQFIGGIIRDAPPQVVDMIERLSGRVPAHIVQCIEWLLDMSAVRVVHRGSVGIIDHQRFISKVGRLPGSMVSLLADRYDFLAEAPAGEAAQRVLLAAALVGSEVPAELLSLAGSDLESAVRDLLMGRRLLERAENEARLRWHHENLLLHFRNWLFGELRPPRKEPKRGRKTGSGSRWADRGRELARDAAVQLRRRPELLEGMDRLSLGRLASLAGDHPAAVELWRPMLDDLRRVAGYSTADIPAGYYEHLRFAYESVQKVGQEPELLPSILKSMTYIGGFSLSLEHGCGAAEYGIGRVGGIALPDAQKRRLRFWLRCLNAHFLLDAGFVRLAQGLFLELQADFEADEALRTDAQLGFEVYNCLGQLYGYLNHAILALRCFDIADLYADRLGDARLKGKQLADRSLLYQFSDFAEWMRLAQEAESLNATSGTVRHQRHASIVMLSLQFLTLRSHPGELERIGRELDAMQKDCEAASYFSLLPRFYLLRAAIAYAVATENLTATRHADRWLDLAEQAADHGLGIGTERGIGFTSWQLRNLKAMVALRRGNHRAARENLQSAYEIMRADGLLFLGNADLACPNQVVLANYVKLLHSTGRDHEVKAALRDVRTYGKADWTQDDDYDFAVQSSLEHDALLGRRRVGSGLARDEKTGMGLVVWLP
jgi:hypothetical protein